MRLVRESIHARYNYAPQIAKEARKAALQRFGAICKDSYNSLYEDRQDFVSAVGVAFKRIEAIAEDKYINGLEYFDCTARIQMGEDIGDLEIVTQATDKHMAARQIRNKIAEEYGFDAKLRHVFVDGEKFSPRKIREYRPAR